MNRHQGTREARAGLNALDIDDAVTVIADFLADECDRGEVAGAVLERLGVMHAVRTAWECVQRMESARAVMVERLGQATVRTG